MDNKWNELERRISQLEAEVRELKAEQRPGARETIPPPVMESHAPNVPPQHVPEQTMQQAVPPQHVPQQTMQHAVSPQNVPQQTMQHAVPGHNVPQQTVPPVQERTREPVDWEYTLGRVWLPRVFLFVLLFGLIWGFKAAVDSGIITESIRVLLGGLLATGLLLYGFRQMKAKRGLLGSVLLGGSICVYMLATFAAHDLYGFLHGSIAFALNVLWVGLAVALAHRYRSQGLAVLAAVGGVLVPLLVHINGNTSLFYAAFEVLVYGTFLWYSLKMSYRALYYVSAGLFHVALLMLVSAGGDPEVFAVTAAAQHIFLLVAYVVKKVRINEHAATLLASLALTSLWILAAFDRTVMNGVLIGFLVLYAASVYYLMTKSQKAATSPLIGTATYALLLLVISTLEGNVVPIVVIWQGIIAIYLGKITESLFQRINGYIVYGLGFLLTLLFLTDGMQALFSMQTLLWLSLIGSMLVLRWIEKGLTKPVNIGIAVALLLMLTDVTNCLTAGLSDDIRRLSLSFGWALYAAAVMVYGVVRKVKQVRGIGLVMIFITLFKVIFFDLPNVPLAVRAVMFIGIGLIGILLSRLLYRRNG